MKYSSEETQKQTELVKDLLATFGTLIVTHKGGNSYRLDWVDGGGKFHNLTYAYAVMLGVTCRNKDGRNVVSLTGGNYSKSDKVCDNLRHFAGISGRIQVIEF